MNFAIRHILAAIFLFLACFNNEVSADKAYRLNENGIKSYENRKFEESEEYFTQALVDKPTSPDLKFNLGTSLSGQKKFEEAVKQLENAAAEFSDPKKSAAAYFNAGNSNLASGNLDNAIADYVNALKLDQNSEDIRYNLEFTIRKKQQQEQQQQQDKQDDNEDKKNDEENKDNQKQQDSDKNEDENKEQEQKQDQQDSETQNQNDENSQDSQDQQSQQQQSEERQMTPEEAKRILDALSDEEKKALSLKKMKIQMEMKQGDDW